MAGIDIGRTGSIGLAIETSPGVANTSPAVYLPYMANNMRGHHEAIANISSKTSRIMDTSSVVGKRWAEGDVEILADVVNSGYLWKLALGNELYAAGTPSVHTFYPTVSGNTPLTATLINTRGTTDVEQYTFATLNELDFAVAEGLATIKATFQAQYPTTGAAQTVTTTSGTVFAFKDYFIRFGGNLTSAGTNPTTPVNEFSLKIANDLETIFRSGNSQLSTIRNKGLRVTGTYTLYFDNVTDRDAYYGLNKRSMLVTVSGINGATNPESMTIRIAQFRLTEAAVDSGLDNFYILKASFTAEDVVDTVGTRFLDVTLKNDKASTY